MQTYINCAIISLVSQELQLLLLGVLSQGLEKARMSAGSCLQTYTQKEAGILKQ